MLRTLSLAVSCLTMAAVVDGHSFHYANHQRVDLLVNTVGPFNNPTETYPVSSFTSLISCLLSYINLFYNIPCFLLYSITLCHFVAALENKNVTSKV